MRLAAYDIGHCLVRQPLRIVNRPADLPVSTTSVKITTHDSPPSISTILEQCLAGLFVQISIHIRSSCSDKGKVQRHVGAGLVITQQELYARVARVLLAQPSNYSVLCVCRKVRQTEHKSRAKDQSIQLEVVSKSLLDIEGGLLLAKTNAVHVAVKLRVLLFVQRGLLQ